MYHSDSMKTFTAFDQTLDLIWDAVRCDSQQDTFTRECTDRHFQLLIPEVARICALPEENCIKIEPLNSQIGFSDIHRWFYSSMIAYILQYRGYHVLHGSAVLMQDEAVIVSGHSGAGKSTLAAAMMQKGYHVLTDDLAVIQRTDQGQYCLIPGPNIVKLCIDSMQHLNYEQNNGITLPFKKDKYGFNFDSVSKAKPISIKAFYEISVEPSTNRGPLIRAVSKPEALKTLMHHAYRYFMLKPLGKLQYFMNACSEMVEQIDVYHIQRTQDFHDLPKIIQSIEQEQGI